VGFSPSERDFGLVTGRKVSQRHELDGNRFKMAPQKTTDNGRMPKVSLTSLLGVPLLPFSHSWNAVLRP